ncbi:hypothetical protein, partial [Sutterella wadsworthensis]|uniref:hypothetical protein n=1 Tax=Sutterella wadsworthensis TaxID=40545 RepID=UPI002432ADD5
MEAQTWGAARKVFFADLFVHCMKTGGKTMGPFLLTSSKSLKTLTLRHGSRGIVQNVTSTSKH